MNVQRIKEEFAKLLVISMACHRFLPEGASEDEQLGNAEPKNTYHFPFNLGFTPFGM